MTEREKLIDLIVEAKRTEPETGSFTDYLADYLLEHGVIILPCKVGDTVCHVFPKKGIQTNTVRQIRIGSCGMNILADLYKSTDNMSRILESATAKEENFRKRIVKTKDITGKEDYEERVFDSFDALAVRQMTGAIKDLAAAVRDVYSLTQESRKDENNKGGNTLELVMPEGCEGFDG